MKMKTPKEFYMFPQEDYIQYADTDETPDQQGVKYIRADQITEIEALAISDMANYYQDQRIVSTNEMRNYAKRLRNLK